MVGVSEWKFGSFPAARQLEACRNPSALLPRFCRSQRTIVTLRMGSRRLQYTFLGIATMRPSMQRWIVIYAATILICLALAFTAGPRPDRQAQHTGAIIVIFGIVALWRLSRR